MQSRYWFKNEKIKGVLCWSLVVRHKGGLLRVLKLSSKQFHSCFSVLLLQTWEGGNPAVFMWESVHNYLAPPTGWLKINSCFNLLHFSEIKCSNPSYGWKITIAIVKKYEPLTSILIRISSFSAICPFWQPPWSKPWLSYPSLNKYFFLSYCWVVDFWLLR